MIIRAADDIDHSGRVTTSVPLVSAEESSVGAKIREIAAEGWNWIRSLFARIFRRVTRKPAVHPHVPLAVRTLRASKEANKPQPMRFCVHSLREGVPTWLLSRYIAPPVLAFARSRAEAIHPILAMPVQFISQPLESAFSAFVGNKMVAATSSTIFHVANYCFPAHSPTIKRVISLTLTIPAVWIMADRLKHPLGWPFFLSMAPQVLQLIGQIRSQSQARKARSNRAASAPS